jgi:DNA-directed RNA polymerase subunit RPC12/RpoP
MIYVCAKCEFLFERKNDPSKCPSCENQYVMDANKAQQQTYKELYGNKNDAGNNPKKNPIKHNEH